MQTWNQPLYISLPVGCIYMYLIQYHVNNANLVSKVSSFELIGEPYMSWGFEK